MAHNERRYQHVKRQFVFKKAEGYVPRGTLTDTVALPQ